MLYSHGPVIICLAALHPTLPISLLQVAEYVKKFREAFWPNGVLAEATPAREEGTAMRTRVLTKTKLHGVIPGVRH